MRALLPVLLFLLVSVPGVLSQTTGVAPSSSGQDPDPPGKVEIYIFSPEGLPQEGVQVTLEKGDVYRSNSSGLLLFPETSGKRDFRLFLRGEEVAKVSLQVVSGKTVDTVVNLQASGIVNGGETWEAAPNKNTPPALQEDLSDRPRGKVSGQLVHIDTGKGIAGALVIFRGWDQDIRTDSEGKFTADIPLGTWSVSLVHPEFSTQTLAEVKVEGQNAAEIKVQMTPSAIQLESLKVLSGKDIKVQGGLEAILEETRNSSSVLSLLGAEQISRNGDGDAAQALSRVTGLTLVDGKFVYVRGMGDRYSTSTLNGLRLPSPEIDKRVVPLDLFPSNVIESLSIQKSFTPDMNGEFGGGVVNIRTRGIPPDRFERRLRWNLGMSLTYDPDLSFKNQLLGHEGRLDWLGLDDGDRQLPVELRGTDKRIQEETILQPGYTPEELQALATSLPDTWKVDERMFWPSWGLNLGVRDKHEWDVHKFGYASSLIYRMDFDRRDSSKLGPQTPDGKTFTYKYDVSETSKGVDYGILHAMEYQWTRALEVSSTTLALRSSDNILEKTQGPYEDQIIEYYDYYWMAQSLIMEALGIRWSPEFLLGGTVHIDYGFSRALREEPSHMYARFNKDLSKEEGKYVLFQNAGFPLRMFVDVSDTIHEVQGKLSLPLGFLPVGDVTLNLGGSYFHQVRDSRARKIKTIFEVDFGGDQFDWTDDPLTLREFTRPTDNFQGSHRVTAFFGVLDFLVFQALRTSAGIRYEDSLQKVSTYDPFTKAEIPSGLAVRDLLPSLSLTLPFLQNHQIRASYYQTVNRPDLTELSATIKEGAPGEGEIWGNTLLREAHIANGDARYEFYLNKKENISLGGFYKYFTDVIESSSIAGSDPRIQAVNIPQATNWGLEVEWNLSLFTFFGWTKDLWPREFLTTEDFLRTRLLQSLWNGILMDLAFSGNVTFIRSEVDYTGGDQGVLTSSVRPLQGQSPYVVNLSLGYKNALSWFPDVKSDTGVYLNYNVFGPRIKKLGSNGFPDNYEQPFHQLDLILKHRFSEYFSLDLKIKNLLDPDSIIQMGAVEISKLKKGRSFSLGIKVDF